MALVLPFALLRPIHPRGNVSLLASQRRAPGAVASGSRLWVPSDLGSKLKMWLKGDDLSGTNGSSVATWTDASGNSNNATGATANPTLVTAGLNGLNTVSFDSTSSQYFTLSTGLLSGRTQSASFAVYKLNASPPSALGSGGPVFGDFGTDGLGNHNPFTDGNFYDDYCTDTRRGAISVSASTAFRIFGLRSKTNDWRLDINGTNQFTDATNTFATNSAPLLGFSAAGARYLDGQIAETVDCNDFLTTAEKEQVEGYLAWKWGIQASLPGGHTYASAAPTVGGSSPDVTLALTGQLLTSAIGSLLASTTLSLTGQSASIGQGSVGLGAALTGQSLSVAQGSVTEATSTALSGQSATVTRGTILAATSQALSGQSLNAAQGTLSPSTALSLTGQASSVTQGSVTQSRVITLSGQGTTLAQGSASPAIAVTISGQSLAVAQGTLSVSLPGNVTAALTGLSLSVAQGSVAGAVTTTLSGQSAAISRGSVAPLFSLGLSGQSLTGSQGSVVVAGIVLPTPPYTPPAIFYGFHTSRPISVTWGAASSSGAAWKPDSEEQNNWTNGSGQSGANWKKS